MWHTVSKLMRQKLGHLEHIAHYSADIKTSFQEKFMCWILLPRIYMHYLASALIRIFSSRKNSYYEFGKIPLTKHDSVEFWQAVYLFYAWQPCFQKRANPLILNG